MKKLFVVALAALSMVACVNEDITEIPNGGAISFENAFIDNATRAAVDPSFNNDNLASFNVWGYVEDTSGVVFKGTEVTNNNGVYTYEGTQYWGPDKHYYFAAVAGVTVEDVTATDGVKPTAIAFTNVDGTQDLIYAYKDVVAMPAGQDNDAVELVFNHILSKVKFSFTNGFPTSNVTVAVEDITMTAVKSANYKYDELNGWAWADHADTTTLAFGGNDGEVVTTNTESANERLIIPTDGEQEYNIAFTIVVKQGGVEVNRVTKTSTISGVAFDAGRAYNLTAEITPETLGMDEIEFTVVVNDWEEGVVEQLDWTYNKESKTYTLHTAEGLKWFAEQVNGGKNFSGETVNLTTDIDLSQVATRAATYAEWTPIGINNKTYFNGTFDGNGHTVSNFQVTQQKEGWSGLFGYAHAPATIKNLNVENVLIDAYHYAGAIVGQGYAKIENCHVNNVDITLTTYNNDLGDKAGGIIGQNLEGYLFVKNSSAKNVTIKGYRDLGGIAGMAHGNNIVSGCSVENITITQDLSVHYEKEYPTTLGGVVGRFGSNVTYENNTEKNVAITIEVPNAEALAAALKANKENISVILTDNIELPIKSLGEQTAGSGEYKIGGENTEVITIDLNKKKLNITTSYWSALGAKNADALITIKNGEMTSTGNSAGTWNAWDLRFSNCNYVFENVDFGKAVALDNVGKSVYMKNVTITDTHNTDTYGLWITAEGQTVTLENCIIDMTLASDGRGIKIDEQYVNDDTKAKVTLNVQKLTVVSEEKAAIVVKSAAGAEINVDGIDITNVTEDNVFAVWVDEDSKEHAAKVVVNGANVKVEGTVVNMVEVNSVEALKEALIDAGNAGSGNTIINLAKGEYTMPADWTPITVDGYHGADIVTVNGNGSVLKGMTSSLFNGGFAGGSGIVIKDLTIEDAEIVATNTQGYGAFINCADSMAEITLINCHLIDSSIITPNDGASESRMGGLVGWTSGYSNVNDGPVKTYVNIKNCSVVGCTLKGFGSIGGICGHAGASDWTWTTIENCTVKNNKLISTDDGSWRVGVAVGTANIGHVVVNNLIESGNELIQGTLEAPVGIRSYVGRLSFGSTGSFTVDGVSLN